MDPRAGVGSESSMDDVRKASGNAVRSAARPGGASKFIDDHVAGADGPGAELPIVEIANSTVTAEPVQNNFCEVERTTQGAALQPRVINRSGASLAPRADSVAN